jgi:hypothetical protein
MKKIWNRMGKGLMFVLVIAAVSLFACCMMKMNRMQVTLNELMSQLFYLQDSTAVLQSDLGSMETNIEAALEEESSLIEEYTIKVQNCDFAKGTYSVDITVLPKEYTEATQLTVYFGAKGFPLELQGILFRGTATLSMDNNYDGNVTVLFTNGEKRSTEVLGNYRDFQTTLKQALGGSMDGVTDSLADGVWEFEGAVDYELDGQDCFEFESFHLIAEVGADTVYDYDLIHETGGATALASAADDLADADVPQDQTGGGEIAQTAENQTGEVSDDADGLTGSGTGTAEEEPAESEAAGSEEDNASDSGSFADETIPDAVENDETASEEDGETISGMRGVQDMAFTCQTAENASVKIYLTAVTKEGVTLRLTLFEGVLSNDKETRITELTTFSVVLDYYDKNHVMY